MTCIQWWWPSPRLFIDRKPLWFLLLIKVGESLHTYIHSFIHTYMYIYILEVMISPCINHSGWGRKKACAMITVEKKLNLGLVPSFEVGWILSSSVKWNVMVEWAPPSSKPLWSSSVESRQPPWKQVSDGQGCQILYLHTQTPNGGIFWKAFWYCLCMTIWCMYFMAISLILWQFGT
jgi:hypothetical protein